MRTIISCILLLLAGHISAQQLSLKGTVKDLNRGMGLENVNIRLLKTDSTFVEGVVTDSKGKFELKKAYPGDWLMICTMIGYKETSIRLDNLQKSTNVEDIWMEEAIDSLATVVIVGQQSIRKAGRQIVFPSTLQRNASFSAFEMLSKMTLPGLEVNVTQNSIKSMRNGNVQLRINGVESTVQDALAILPSQVMKVEYIDMPGARYGDGVTAVINLITKRASEGLSGGTNWKNAATTGYGNDNFFLKYNNKASEFSLNYDLSYRNFDDNRTDISQTFMLADGSERKMEKTGIESPFKQQTHNLSFAYNLTRPEKSVFNVKLSNNWLRTPYYNTIQLIRETGQPDLTAQTGIRDISLKPSLDIYYQLNLPAEQSLKANLVGTYISSDYTRNYAEYLPDNTLARNELNYTVDGDKYSVIGEFIYSKGFKENHVWNSGIRYSYSYLENHYWGSTGNVVPSMDNSDLYLFSELEGSINKLNYNIGVGVSRQYFKEGEHEYKFYTFRPTVSLSYVFSDQFDISYQFSIRPLLPQLAQISDVDQWQNPYEVVIGNPDLKPYRAFINNLAAGYEIGPFYFYLTGYYQRNNNPISRDAVNRVETDDSYYFEYRVANQKRFEHLQGKLYIYYEVIKDILNLSVTGGINHYINNGNLFYNTYTGGFWRASVDAMYKKFSLSASYGSWTISKFGEYENHYRSSADINLSYRIKNNLRVGIGLINPFFKDGEASGEVLDSKVVKKETWEYVGNLKNAFYVTFAWNFNIGKKHKAGRVQLFNSDSDSGVIK